MGRRRYSIDDIRSQLAFADEAWQYEVTVWGKVSWDTRWYRHYLIKRLVARQIQDFSRD